MRQELAYAWKVNLGYAWRVLVNLTEIGIVLLIFARLYENQTIVIVAAIGLIYAAVRNLLGANATAIVALGKGLIQEFAKLRLLLGDPDFDAYEIAAAGETERLDQV